MEGQMSTWDSEGGRARQQADDLRSACVQQTHLVGRVAHVWRLPWSTPKSLCHCADTARVGHHWRLPAWTMRAASVRHCAIGLDWPQAVATRTQLQ
eukprot:366122-Chlamydomonas_euryale.AAC.7